MIRLMIEGFIDTAFRWLLIIGLPALFGFFVLKGALIGKPLPTTVFLPGYVLAISASGVELAGIALVSSGGYVGGQLLIYYGTKRGGVSYINSSPRVSIPETRLDQVERWFESYGGIGIFATTLVPYIRGLITIPAAVAAYPVWRLVVFVWSATFIYHLAVIAAAVGLIRAIW